MKARQIKKRGESIFYLREDTNCLLRLKSNGNYSFDYPPYQQKRNVTSSFDQAMKQLSSSNWKQIALQEFLDRGGRNLL